MTHNVAHTAARFGDTRGRRRDITEMVTYGVYLRFYDAEDMRRGVTNCLVTQTPWFTCGFSDAEKKW